MKVCDFNKFLCLSLINGRLVQINIILYCNKTLYVQKSDSTPEVNGGSCDG